MKKAFITGITGQDGSYLAEFLLSKNYEVHGLVRRSSSFNRQRIDHLHKGHDSKDNKIHLHYGDMTDFNSLITILRNIRPDEIYNLAAQSHVKISFEMPSYTAQTTGFGVLNLIEAVYNLGLKSKIYQASTSELYSGDPGEAPQSEKTPFKPKSPYGAAKLYAYEIARIYRESYGMFICNGILFNHESPRRGDNFVTKKIVIGVADIIDNKQEKIYLGNLDAKRDWGYAPEYVQSMWKMLQQKNPDDYVIATGKTHSVREFTELAFKYAGVNIVWKGRGSKEKGVDRKTGRVLVEIDSDYFRPNEVSYLCGNPAKAKKILGWEPKTDFRDLVKIMIEDELKKRGIKLTVKK